MDLKAEAQRVMAVALGKMYSCRLQRGGARLHRSLLLSLVLRGAQDVYLGLRTARLPAREEPAATVMEVEDQVRGADSAGSPIELMDCSAQPLAATESPSQRIESQGVSGRCIQSGQCEPAQKTAEHQPVVHRAERGRKRTKVCPEPEGLPSKRARLEEQEEREASPPPSHVLASSLGTGLQIKVKEQPVTQGPPIWRDRVLGELSMWVRPIVAY
ncbi:immediate early response gene 2 protein-like [Hypanus sabinus]|uniref:immediate early response gene 2 protein-like n=1 Tax=Hypanus sabinus TaxID=79690 RepID=UPI0028C44F01|nr:immediate early response gene 2 protein-like [Hypanus sabinus]